MKKKLKTAKGRSTSSVKWLSRQLKDPFVAMAKKDGFLSRAAYKLIEINQKFKLFNSQSFVIDLGASPGSWIQVLIKEKVDPKKIIALDLKDLNLKSDVHFIKGDFTDSNTRDLIKQSFGSNKPSVILSDMAANSTGNHSLDHDLIMNLADDVFDFAVDNLSTSGALVIKILQGGSESEFRDKLKTKFKTVNFFKPKSSRNDSTEIYFVAQNFFEA